MKFKDLKKITERINKLNLIMEQTPYPTASLQEELRDEYSKLYPCCNDYNSQNDYFVVDVSELIGAMQNFFDSNNIACKLEKIPFGYSNKMINITVGNTSYKIGSYIGIKNKCSLLLCHIREDMRQLIHDFPEIYSVFWEVIKQKYVQNEDEKNPQIVR